MALIDVCIPVFGRTAGLAVVLTSLLGQTFTDFDVIISDQTDAEERPTDSVEVRTLIGALQWHGHHVTVHHHLPRRGLAEQRQFLLEQSPSSYVQYLDNDVALGPRVIERMLRVIQEEKCGFVGCPATSPDYLDDIRPHQQAIELWDGPVRPETFSPSSIPWERHLVNNAANPLHLQQKLITGDEIIRYKIAWVGGANILYDREKLLDVGGFSWWRRLPPEHAGEEVLTQFLLIRRYGGCGILPTETYHLGFPTTVVDRSHNATELFAALIAELEGNDIGTADLEQTAV